VISAASESSKRKFVRIRKTGLQLVLAARKGIRNVLQEDQTEHDVLVLGCVHLSAQLVGCCPKGASDVVD